jgi:CubicO group peptidase (beta-lactamase class C family)
MLGEIRKKAPAIHSLLVIRHDNVILDANFYPFIAGTRHDIASVTKSVTSLLVGAAILQGQVKTLDQRIFDLIHERPSQPDQRKDRITLGDLLAMRSGFDCGSHGEAELDAMRATRNWVQAAVNLPMREEPGTKMAYCSPNYHIVSKALHNLTGMPMAQFAQRSLFSRLGIEDYFWPADANGVTHGWGDLQLTTRDLAKIGYLLLHDGVWDGTRILPAGWIASTSKPISKFNASDSYGMGWWTHPSAPPGMYEAIGRGGQRLTIWPAKDLIVVFTGGGFEPGDIGGLLLAAYKADTAMAPDPAGADQLRLGLALAAQAPAAAAVSSSPPEAARRASGRAFDFPANDFQLRSLSFFFDPRGERVHMDLADRKLDLPIGFDGRYRIATDSIDGIPPGTRGMFRGDNELVLDLNLIGKINRYEFDIRFLENEMSVGIVELTGTFRTSVVGRRRH